MESNTDVENGNITPLHLFYSVASSGTIKIGLSNNKPGRAVALTFRSQKGRGCKVEKKQVKQRPCLPSEA